MILMAGLFDALQLAQAWKLTPINLGQVGHINVASGFGPFSWTFSITCCLKKIAACKPNGQANFNLKFA